MQHQANELDEREILHAEHSIWGKEEGEGESVESEPEKASRHNTGGKQVDGDGQILQLTAQREIEREGDQAGAQGEAAEQQRRPGIVGR